MKILVSGSTGLIGSALVRSAAQLGHEPVRLVRSEPPPGQPAVVWHPAAGSLDAAALVGLDAVVHLAGENVADGRWTAAKKERIRRSRVEGTRLLSDTLAHLERPPRLLASASAVGYYGSRGDEDLDESSPPGEGFLADVCREWEAATGPAAAAGIRVVNLRFAPVLAGEGGMLGRIAPLFRWFLGGRLGDGRQYMSWITLDDAVSAIEHVLSTEALAGPVNVSSPRPVTNREFTAALARVMRRPAVLPVPAFALRLALGQMADEMLLSSIRVVPRRLAQSGFAFGDPELEPALRRLLQH
jgi:uncharacterized protein (TIGR01777 family)